MNLHELVELRELNFGYNPEKAEDHGTISKIDEYTILIACDGTVMKFDLTYCVDEVAFIKEFPKRYGVLYKGKYYLLDN